MSGPEWARNAGRQGEEGPLGATWVALLLPMPRGEPIYQTDNGGSYAHSTCSARRLVRAHWAGARHAWRPEPMIPLALACALVVVVCVAIGAFSKHKRKARLRE
jgi:hypothetical protein